MTTASDPSDRHERLSRALGALRGLAVGDALGSQFFVPDNLPLLRSRQLPPPTWQWTDDTEMAASVLAVLVTQGEADQDALAASFARHHDFDRGYGPAVNRMLRQIRQEGGDWRELSAALFEGQGSWGNGGAMRVAPLGAWFAGDPQRVADEAQRSAEVTHRHPEAVAGTRAVAVAAALRGAPDAPARNAAQFLSRVLEFVPRSAVHAGLRRAVDMLDYDDIRTVAAVLGCGRRTSAQDTVPFALWVAARHQDDYRAALWAAAEAGGDVDTTCAIIGGIVASAGPHAAPPAAWTARTEPLPGWLTDLLA
ncbi:ADP-ribosylglycohydrolase family protein [Streptomyces cacaoi]|uniref:Hydrolase n=1 Tax=Streptomyces cacaoi TaxID=1898 RepID=A0A4Y3QX59_STRCI|nr:ADP-ribosylglycohydrolase family protein [Streptomyces cacaoi]NNG86087.1 ADP-ribosylglycohydrolase family protein [Streptomyces cacaoi]GEB49984.1 hydrolase [Streptomyces cacaoi]